MGFLQKAVSDNGLQTPEAYHRISGMFVTQSRVEFTLSSYASIEFFKENNLAIPLFSKEYNFVPDVTEEAKNIFKQGYEYLFSLPEYKNAIDVLEEGQFPISS